MTFNTHNFNNCNKKGTRTYSHLLLMPMYEGSCKRKSNKKKRYNYVSLSAVRMLFLFPLFFCYSPFCLLAILFLKSIVPPLGAPLLERGGGGDREKRGEKRGV
jgi:hypothetical protein